MGFYEGADAIQCQTLDDFRDRVVGAGGDGENAPFLLRAVHVDHSAPDAERHGREIFRTALCSAFPTCDGLTTAQLDAVRQALADLLKSRKCEVIRRAELEKALWGAVPAERRASMPALRLHTANDPVRLDEIPSPIRFDWHAYSGSNGRAFPPAPDWVRLVEQLTETKRWIQAAERPRRLRLSGSRRLTPCVALGAVFRAAEGFVFEMEYRGDLWCTDSYPDAETPPWSWNREERNADAAGDMAVVIGVGKDIGGDVDAYLQDLGLEGLPRLSLFSPAPLLSPAHTNSAAQAAKAAMAGATSARGPKAIHLFLGVPAHFALFLGHRLNALGRIQCYEFAGPGRYTPTCDLDCT